MLLNFRAMTEEDLSVVCSIEQQAGDYPWSASHIKSSLNAGHRCIVVLQKESIVGYGVLMHGVDEAELLILTIKKTDQKKGYGRELLEYLIKDTVRKARRVFLEVRQSNFAALSLYQRVGFYQVGIRKNYYPCVNGREDAVVMVFECSSATAITDRSFPHSNKE